MFVFQIGSTLTTASNAVVDVINGGSDCNAFWQIGSSATLGTGTAFAGSILALTSITSNTSSDVSGQLLARNGAVTFDTITASLCVPVCPLITVDPETVPTGVQPGVPYSVSITATGGTAPYTFAVTAGALPPGLMLSSAGLLSGTPTTSGTSIFTITATDQNGCQVSQAYTILVNPPGCPTIAVLPPTLPNPRLNRPYTESISATGGTGLYIFSVTSGFLPPGLAISPLTATPSILLSGTPTAVGDYSFTITATDKNGCPGTEDYVLSVATSEIPTLSGWAMILLAGVLALAGFAAIRRSGM